MKKDIKNIFKNYWYYCGVWHNADCHFITSDWGNCNCKTGKNNQKINELLKTTPNTNLKDK